MTTPTYTLTWRVTRNPHYGEPALFVPAGVGFSPSYYASDAGIDADAIDPDAASDACDACARLKPGEWLVVTHEPFFPVSQ